MNTSPAHMSILPPGLCFGDASNCQQMWGPGPSLLTADREACQIKRYMGNKTGQAGFAFKFHQLPLEGHHFALGIHPSATSESHSQYRIYYIYYLYTYIFRLNINKRPSNRDHFQPLVLHIKWNYRPEFRASGGIVDCPSGKQYIPRGGKGELSLKCTLGYVRSQVCSLLNFVVVVVDLSISNLQGLLELGYQLSRR